MNTETRLVALCGERGLSLATAESCTGGMVAARLTTVPGASAVFPGGVVAYANEIKERALGVPSSILSSAGAVSAECACAMARGARAAMQSDLAVAVTGIAGPGGGTPSKPVGLVWFGLASPQGTRAESRLFSGDRHSVRVQATEHALALLLALAAAD